MALKAGRAGVSKEQVDGLGNIIANAIKYSNPSKLPGVSSVKGAIDALANGGGGGGGTASSVTYNNTVSGLQATNVQAALDELAGEQETLGTGKENKGKITISGVEKTASSHTVTIVTNGETSTFNLVGVS